MDETIRQSQLHHRFARVMDAAHVDGPIIVALSGGLDSVALLHFTRAWQPNSPLLAAHVNHRLRGADADADAAFCRALAGRLGFEYHEHTADAALTAKNEGVGVEEAGRRIRYRFFRELAGQSGVVLTAHHADDQVETILLNLRRGAHARGLAGMRENNVVTVPPNVSARVVRPFLGVRKMEIEEFARSHGWEWCEDATNIDVHYSRNRIRRRIVPILEKLAPGFSERLLGRAEAMRADDDKMSEFARNFLSKASRHECGGLFLDHALAASLEPETMSYAIREIVEAESGRLLSGKNVIADLRTLLLTGQLNETIPLPGGLHVRKEYDGLFFFFPEAIVQDAVIPLPPAPFTVEANGIVVEAAWIPEGETMPDSDRGDANVQWLNPKVIQWPLCLRPPLTGERFQAMGAPGSRKIHDLLVDMKVPRRKRGTARVLADQEGALWVWPLRTSERARLPQPKGPALRVCITP